MALPVHVCEKTQHRKLHNLLYPHHILDYYRSGVASPHRIHAKKFIYFFITIPNSQKCGSVLLKFSAFDNNKLQFLYIYIFFLAFIINSANSCIIKLEDEKMY